MTLDPQLGDMFECRKCTAQIHVTRGCDCDTPCADFQCCGLPMENVTEPAVQTADDTELNDGLEISSDRSS
ncbi:hypothetical protein MFFC18_14710 [Mariniblastus fucicola]|uniref:Desulfoferrodoxin N-terminal domain-containing protein n=1 Tax=Mariniblastus fucicola TaxID=980251 RepID=A0A5B9PFE1_9BACT|nr:hypothetical protein MFFC18_14710 [Mariniblastus fucicola]